MPLILTILVIAIIIYITKEPLPMFDSTKHYKVSFNDLTTKDHQVKETNIQGDFGSFLEEMQAQGKINNLTVLDSWEAQDSAQFITNNI